MDRLRFSVSSSPHLIHITSKKYSNLHMLCPTTCRIFGAISTVPILSISKIIGSFTSNPIYSTTSFAYIISWAHITQHWGPNSPIKQVIWEILKRYGRQKSFLCHMGGFFIFFGVKWYIYVTKNCDMGGIFCIIFFLVIW